MVALLQETHKTASSSSSQQQTYYPELMLWMLFLGRYAADVHMEPEKAWFNNKLLETILIPNISEWQDARQILGGFLYVDRVFRKRFLGIWGVVLARPDEMGDADLYEHPCMPRKAFISIKKFLGYK